MTKRKRQPPLTRAQRSIRMGVRILFDACRQDHTFCGKLIDLINTDPEWQAGARAECIVVEDGKLVDRKAAGRTGASHA